MRRLIRLRFVAVALGAATGLVLVASVYSVASNLQTEESKGDPAQNPCFGLTDSECAALIADSEKEFEAKYATWLADFNSRDIDLRTLPTAPLNADYPAPLTDLDAAVGAADVIVVATAKSVRFEPQWAHLTLVVEQTIKGSTAGEITVRQGGGPDPYPDWDSVVLAIAEADPLLFPGDRAVLFLRHLKTDQIFEVQAWTGHYRINGDNKIAALEFNPFSRSVDGVALEDFAAAVQAAATKP